LPSGKVKGREPWRACTYGRETRLRSAASTETASDWDYEPLSATETQEFTEMLQADGLATVLPCEPCEMGYGGPRPEGPLTFVEAVLTA